MMTYKRLLGLGDDPPPPPPPDPPPPGPPPGPPGPPPGAWGPMMWPPYQPPTVYIQRGFAQQTEAPCKWYEDLQGAGDTVYCRAPAVWLVIAGAGIASLFMMARKKG